MQHPMDERTDSPGAVPERTGDLARGVERHEFGHMPALSPTFPERHIAGAGDLTMAPAIPSRRSSRTIRIARIAGAGAGRAHRLFASTGSVRNIKNLNVREIRGQTEGFIAGHPTTLILATLAGYVLGRILKR